MRRIIHFIHRNTVFSLQSIKKQFTPFVKNCQSRIFSNLAEEQGKPISAKNYLSGGSNSGINIALRFGKENKKSTVMICGGFG